METHISSQITLVTFIVSLGYLQYNSWIISMVQGHFPLKYGIIPLYYFRAKNKSNFENNAEISIKNSLQIILKIDDISYIQKVGENLNIFRTYLIF